MIDDDHLPLPDNILHNAPDDNDQAIGDAWGHDGICWWRMSGANDVKAKLNFLTTAAPT